MRTVDLRSTRYRVPFKQPLVTAHGTFPVREGAILETVMSDGSIGVGEIAPPPGFGVSLDQVLSPLSRLADLARTGSLEFDASTWRELPASLRFALDTALATVTTHRLTVAQPGRPPVAVNATVASVDVDEAASRARQAIEQGYRCVKLKVGVCQTVDAEIERVAQVRDAIGPDSHLRLDANEAWDFACALAVLQAVAPHNIQYCEQPLSRDDLGGMRRLREAQSVPIAADEALMDLAGIRRVLAAHAADLLVLKPQCLGAFDDCRELVERLPKGIDWIWTSSMESGVGAAATAVIASRLPSQFACGLATLDLLEDDLIVAPPRIDHGCLYLPPGPGYGVELDRAALARYSV